MKGITLVDQVMNNLAFEVEEVPQDERISSASSNSPLNVKIRIRKKNRKQLQDGGIISIPKIDQAVYGNEKIRVTSSDQTITSFNVLMERGQSIKKRTPKQKRIMQLFKRGGCLGMQNDEDQYEYTKDTSHQADKQNEQAEPMGGPSSDGFNKPNFTLAKNYSNTEASHASKHKHTDFLGKCKPGGCLDPPFGEDKYSYLPKFVDVAGADQTEKKTKTNDCECKETFPNNAEIKSKDEDMISYNPVVKKEKTESLYDSNTSLLQLKNSNSIITFPSISPSTEALNKLQIQRRSKSYSSSRESRSYNASNQLLETYYISPKIKTIDQVPKSITESKTFSDTNNIDISTIKSKENLFGETKSEAQVISDLGVNKNFENAEKVALCLTENEMIPIEILSDVTRGDEPALLKDQEYSMESTHIPRIEKDKPIIINAMPEPSPLNINNSVSNNNVTRGDEPAILKDQEISMESTHIPRIEKDKPIIINAMPQPSPLNINNSVSNPKILLNKQKVESDKEYLYKGDTIPEENLQEIPAKSMESVFTKTENNTETITVLLHDFTDDKADLKKMDGSTEVPLNEINKGIIETLAKSVENDDFKNKNSIEIISSPRDHTTNNESFNEIDVTIKDPLEEINQAIIKTPTKSLECIAITNISSNEMMTASTQDLFYINEGLIIKDDVPEVSVPKEEQENVSSHLGIKSFAKNIDDESKKSSFSKEDLNLIKNTMKVGSHEKNLSFIEVTGSTKNEHNVEEVVSQGTLHDTDDLKIIETAADSHLQDSDRDMTLISKISQDKIKELVDEHHNELEEHVDDNIIIGTKPNEEIFSFEELKSNTIESTSLISSKENKMDSNYSNSVTNLNFQDDNGDEDTEKLGSFIVKKSDAIKPDQVTIQDEQYASVINSEKVSEAQVAVNSLVGNIIHNGNSITEIQKEENPIKSKGGILQDEIYHKDLEVTFSDKVLTESLETSDNILSKPTDEVETPVNIGFIQSIDEISNSKENYTKTLTISSDNVSISDKEEKTLRHPMSKNDNEKEFIHLNMAFQSFQTDEDGNVIRTLNFSSFSDAKRYHNDNILQFKTIIRPNDGEVKIPIDTDKDLVLQITTDQKSKNADQHDGLIKSLPNFNDKISSYDEPNILNEGNDKGSLFPSNNSDLKDNASTVKNSLLDGTKSNEINLQQTLDNVYQDKLLPLHDIIKKLKSDIDELSKQQTLIKEKLYNTKRVQSNPIYTSSKKCGCIEMLFRRL